MKIIINSIVALATFLLSQQITEAQGTITYLSNLGQTSDGNLAVGSDSWIAAGFQTGNNVGGYSFNSVQLGMTTASGNPSGFTVMLYSAITGLGVNPGSNLGTLSGSANPSTAGIYTYTPTANLMLSPSTFYYIVTTAGTAVANGAYNWSFTHTSIYNPGDAWVLSVSLGSSDGSSSWTRLGANPLFDFSQFALTVTAVPEPSVLSLFTLSGLFLGWRLRKAKTVQ